MLFPSEIEVYWKTSWHTVCICFCFPIWLGLSYLSMRRGPFCIYFNKISIKINPSWLSIITCHVFKYLIKLCHCDWCIHHLDLSFEFHYLLNCSLYAAIVVVSFHHRLMKRPISYHIYRNIWPTLLLSWLSLLKARGMNPWLVTHWIYAFLSLKSCFDYFLIFH